jgi:hypothetical protein
MNWADIKSGLSAVAKKLELDRLTSRHKGFFLEEGGESSPAPPDAGSDTASRRVAARAPSLIVTVGSPFIRPHVAPGQEDSTGAALSFATSFVAAWRPQPAPPQKWLDLLTAAPFGTETTSAKELRWNGKEISVERITEQEIEAFVAKMSEWVEYANQAYARLENTPETQARFEAEQRASDLQKKIR